MPKILLWNQFVMFPLLHVTVWTSKGLLKFQYKWLELLAWGTCPARSTDNIIIVSFSKLTSHITMGYSEKIPNTGSWGYTFLKWPLDFHPWKFCKTVLHPLEIPRSEIKTHGNSTWVFVEHPWNFWNLAWCYEPIFSCMWQSRIFFRKSSLAKSNQKW